MKFNKFSFRRTVTQDGDPIVLVDAVSVTGSVDLENVAVILDLDSADPGISIPGTMRMSDVMALLDELTTWADVNA